ncbi:hypothetical protein Alches_21950 [Alicyclobacillus hesperidum subsp. aegles]|nr:hypothetical protein Alches_21950 [Alicyclobacillus hesperidum subsp. aegles]
MRISNSHMYRTLWWGRSKVAGGRALCLAAGSGVDSSKFHTATPENMGGALSYQWVLRFLLRRLSFKLYDVSLN